MQFYTIDQLLNKVLGGGAINVTHNPSAEQVLNMVYNPSYAALNVNILNYAGGGGSVDLSGYYTKTETDNIAATKLAVADVVDSLTSTETAKPLSAAQGKALKTLIDNIVVLLGSDNVNLDTLQEIVDFIELNRATLETLGISNIAGLQNALDAKAAAGHNHDSIYAAIGHTHTKNQITDFPTFKTINGESIEGTGNLSISGSGSVSLSMAAAYHLLSGSLALASSVITAGFATALYTGNGSTQSINTGVDMSTQWGNDASETFGGLVWQKIRSATGHNVMVDTVRGANNNIYTNLTNLTDTSASITAFNNNGFSTASGLSANLATYASWIFQTTHRRTGVTNHGKTFVEHYNPFTGFTIIKYDGSGTVGHEIPHSLGRKLGLSHIKCTSAAGNWESSNGINRLYLNLTNAGEANAVQDLNETNVTLKVGAGSDANVSGNTYILYGWANSYFDAQNNLIGNYEIGLYNGSGVAGNKITTRSKPAWIFIKRVDSTSQYCIADNQRNSFDNPLYANLSNAEGSSTEPRTIVSDGFIIENTSAEVNASGGQYLYMVAYDNDSGSGKSKYPRATDSSTLNLNATVPFADGIDGYGVKNSIIVCNETVTGVTLSQGKNYIHKDKTGAYGKMTVAPSYGVTNPTNGGDFFNILENKWYTSAGAAITNSRNYLDAIVYADHNGQPEYVEQLPKTVYFDKVSVLGGFDLNQKWTDVSSSRVVGVTYTNTTGKPIQVLAISGSAAWGIVINGTALVPGATYSGGILVCMVIPNNATYSLTSGTLGKWLELR
ncbi:MAG: hypothetical protein AB7D29_07700 [Campylobacterales bacterium]